MDSTQNSNLPGFRWQCSQHYLLSTLGDSVVRRCHLVFETGKISSGTNSLGANATVRDSWTIRASEQTKKDQICGSTTMRIVEVIVPSQNHDHQTNFLAR